MIETNTTWRSVDEVLASRLIFVEGKGGVGRSTVSRALAIAHSRAGKKTLWVTFDDLSLPSGTIQVQNASLHLLNCKAGPAFQEYIGMKIGAPGLTKIFLQNNVIQYMAEAAPGIRELVLLGKVWFERDRYDRIVCDMPSTGYALAMFHSTRNFARLFKGGPVHRDAEAMLDTFRDPKICGQLIVTLPEEMPVVESNEMAEHLLELFPQNRPALLVNRRLPTALAHSAVSNPDMWSSPVATDAIDYLTKRKSLEEANLSPWVSDQVPFGSLPYLPPPLRMALKPIAEALAKKISEKGWVG